MRRAPALGPGDRVRLVAPSGPFPRDRFERGVEVLRRYGVEPVWEPDLFDTHRYLAGSDARRLGELQRALDDPSCAAILAVRGGYGAMRLLPRLRLDGMLRRPKLFCGFSDLTALHAMLNRAGLVTLHGPMVCRLGEEPDESLDRLRRLAEGLAPGPLLWEPVRTVTPGVAEGPLVGGNLSVFSRLVGTPYLPPLDGAVLFLEDVGERPYRLDRMLTHLRLAGVAERVAGVLVGQLTACEAPNADYDAETVVAECLAEWQVPCAMGFPAGHGEVNLALPLGLGCRLDASLGRLDFEGPATQS
ncbi:MAG: LD-carboxypeptidase [Deltaproteobacteria bacterium]|nr:MAG: LD-carboxypeptidase [Deltaproteobacteria bacterium]